MQGRQLTSTESEHGMADHQEQQTRPVAIVTGASGGIGEATARALQAAGYRVFGTYRRPPATRSPGIEYLACDVTSDESVQTAVGQVLAKAGRVDLLVNNAGVGLVAGAEESSLEQAKSLFDVNLFGVFRMTKAVLPTMRRQRVGTDRQYQLGHGPDPGAVHGPVRSQQARRGRVFRVAGP